MHPSFLFMIFWSLTSTIHSSTTTFTQIRNTPELRERNPSYQDLSGNAASSSISSSLQRFNCRCEEDDGLAIFCTGIDMVDLAPHIPNDTVYLEITASPLPMLTKPLLSHLHNLRYLKLNDNSHRYITSKAFEGLYNLKVLDLSFNDIIVLSKAFLHTPNLEVLNLTSNQVINVKTIAMALSHLENFRNLSLNHNVRIRKILNDELLPFNNTNLTKLELYNTTINIIEEHAFRQLAHLRVLELSVNYLDEVGLRNVTADLEETSVKILFLRKINLQKGLPNEALSFLGNTSILRLDMGYNYFHDISKFPPIPSLTTLNLPFCSIHYIVNHAFDDLPNLELLDLTNNQFFALNEKITSLPKLEYLSLRYQESPASNQIAMTLAEYAFRNMTNLLFLDLSYIWMSGSIKRFSFYGLRSLKVLLLSNTRISHIDDYAFETLVSLESLDLGNNQLRRLTNYTFYDLNKLNEISLVGNNIKFMPGVYPFQDTILLSFITFNKNEIEEIPEGMFSRLLHLNTLILYGNKIVAWNSTIGLSNENVSVLVLSKNQITHVTPAMMADFQRVTDILDVTENPFNCSACGMNDFQRFINGTNVLLFFSDTVNATTRTYTCSLPENLRGQPVLEVDIPTSHCVPHEINMAVFVITLMLSVMIPTLLVSVFCYITRWYIRYWLFHLEATLKERRHSKNDTKHYLYDAFVSYNASDTPWVVSTLIPALEEQEPRFKLCIHERDFEVGRLITDNILDTIEVSRKVILLLSESFLMSEWCMFELHMAQHKLFDETRDVLVLVKLKNIDRKFYTTNLKYLEKTRTCLSWTDNSVGQKLFWDKMRKALGKPSAYSTNCKT